MYNYTRCRRSKDVNAIRRDTLSLAETALEQCNFSIGELEKMLENDSLSQVDTDKISKLITATEYYRRNITAIFWGLVPDKEEITNE